MSILSYLQDTRGCIFHLVSKIHFESIFPTPAMFKTLSQLKHKIVTVNSIWGNPRAEAWGHLVGDGSGPRR